MRDQPPPDWLAGGRPLRDRRRTRLSRRRHRRRRQRFFCCCFFFNGNGYRTKPHHGKGRALLPLSCRHLSLFGTLHPFPIHRHHHRITAEIRNRLSATQSAIRFYPIPRLASATKRNYQKESIGTCGTGSWLLSRGISAFTFHFFSSIFRFLLLRQK